MKPGDAEAWLEPWRRLGEGFLGQAAATDPAGGIAEATAAFGRFAEGYAQLARPAAGQGAGADWQGYVADLRSLAERFVEGSFPQWPAPPAAGPEWATALDGWLTVLRGIGQDTAARFSASLATDPPASLRAAFDRWIDSAEAAYQAAAHGDAFIASHARLINEFVRQRARQQELIERGARALGLPTRAELDALHDAIRSLRTPPVPAAAAPAATPKVAKRRAPARRAAPRKGRE